MTTAQGELLPENGVAGAHLPTKSRPGEIVGQPVAGHAGSIEHREILCPNDFNLSGRRLVAAVMHSDLLSDISVLVVDDNTLYCEYLTDVLCAHGATATGAAWDLPSLDSAMEAISARVVLIDMTTRNSGVMLRRVREQWPQASVVVTGVAHDDEASIVACAEAGVAGYHLRNESLRDLLPLIERVAHGEIRCSAAVSAILLRKLSALASQQPDTNEELVLTDRENQILGMLELGLSNRDIAAQLHIAVHTVKNHVHSLLTKLGVTSRAQAAAVARSMRGQNGPTTSVLMRFPT